MTDLLSPFIPRPSYINSLPPLSIFGLSLDLMIYLVIGILVFLLIIKRESGKVKQALLFFWLFPSFLYTIQSAVQIYFENGVFGGKSLDEVREITTASGLYSFLKFAQNYIPKNEPVKLILPKEPAYFSQKAPYYLYPHEVLDNALYVLVFNTDYVFSSNNIDLVAKFKEGQYILKRQ